MLFPISCTGLPSSMAYVNRMVRWRLMALDCSPLMESLWCVPACFLWSLLNVLIVLWMRKHKSWSQTEPSANSPSFSFNWHPALSVWRTRDKGVRSRGCGGAALSRPDVPACLLCFWELFGRQGEIQVISSLDPHIQIHKNIQRQKEEKNKKERGYVRTRSENSQPTPKATNFCRSAISARRQLLLM